MNNFMQIENLDEMDKFFENHNLKKIDSRRYRNHK